MSQTANSNSALSYIRKIDNAGNSVSNANLKADNTGSFVTPEHKLQDTTKI